MPDVVVNRRLAARYAVREVMGLAVMAVALFWPAGTVAWWQAWAALAVMALWTAATAVIIFRFNPDLLLERLGPRRGEKRWDMTIVGVLGLVTLVRYILAGFDHRLGWTGPASPAVQWAALAVCSLGNALFVWATASNTFFSRIVRIQTERGHTAVTGGPYRFVRHPAYLGAIGYELAVAVLLGSWPAGVAGAVAAALLVLRTALEDRALRSELDGYADYACRVRYRLLPGVW